MSIQTIRILIAGALFVHGIGHTLGIWKPARSLSLGKIPDSTMRLISGIIWVLIALGFILSAMGFYGVLVPTHWWQPLAIMFAFISLLTLLVLGRNWPLFNFVGASTFNIVLLMALLWFRWPVLNLFSR